MTFSSGFRNPILPGFHPDPTVCRVGDWYYLAVSSFMYFPGVPLYRSRDLVHWQPAGHVLTRPSQFPPTEQAHSDGIFAPTLRHDGKKFYLITTNVRDCGTFVVTADSIEGPWSDPLVLEDAPGIDPSLYFENGRAWITGTADAPEGPRYFGNNEIWLREWNPSTGGWLGPRLGLWRGAVREAVWPEGPHLYKRNGWYYLLISEGGTAEDHAVTVARSQTIEGPYEGNKKNPILTHRHLGSSAPVINVGHPDLVETPDGQWWMVLLASRPHHCGGTNRGRETFLTPVAWENDWPVVSPGSGQLEMSYPVSPAPPFRWPASMHTGGFDGFEGDRLDAAWQFLRCPDKPVHTLADRPGWLRLRGQQEGPGSRLTVAWLGRRVLHEHWTAQCRIDVKPDSPKARAGLCVIQNDEHHLRLEVGQGPEGTEVRMIARIGGQERVVGSRKTEEIPRFLEIGCQGHTYHGRFGSDGQSWMEAAREVDGAYLTTEAAGGFVGCLVGPYAVETKADFDWVDLRGYDE